jgi:cell division protein FtsQ
MGRANVWSTRLRVRLSSRPVEVALAVDTAAPAQMPRLMQALGVCLALAGLFGLARFVQRHLTNAPAFAIDTIDVKGLARVDRSELLQAAGLELGHNVFARSPDEVRSRLLRHPWIVSAQVERKLPSRIEIVIKERAPVALLVVEACSGNTAKIEDDPACEEGSSLYLVSDDAKLFKRLSGKDPVDLPVITGVTRQRFASDPDLQRRILVEAVALMRDYRNSGLWQRNPLGEIHLEANDGYSLYVGEDLTYVRLGVQPFDQKLLRMKKVFERLEREHARAEYIYLDNEQRPDRVAVRLR